MLPSRSLGFILRRAVSTAKAAVAVSRGKGVLAVQTKINSGLWQVFSKFLNSVEKMIAPQVTDVMNSIKVARRIRTALSGSPVDINDLKEPLTLGDGSYQVSRDGFEALLQTNPLLQEESKESLKAFVVKIVIPETEGITAGGSSPERKAAVIGEKDFGALFNRA